MAPQPLRILQLYSMLVCTYLHSVTTQVIVARSLTVFYVSVRLLTQLWIY